MIFKNEDFFSALLLTNAFFYFKQKNGTKFTSTLRFPLTVAYRF